MTVYRFSFKRHVPMGDVQDTLILSVLGVESLRGRTRVRLDGWWCLDRQKRVCQIDASTAVGQDLALLFTGYISMEFGESAFTVHRERSP